MKGRYILVCIYIYILVYVYIYTLEIMKLYRIHNFIMKLHITFITHYEIV